MRRAARFEQGQHGRLSELGGGSQSVEHESALLHLRRKVAGPAQVGLLAKHDEELHFAGRCGLDDPGVDLGEQIIADQDTAEHPQAEGAGYP